MVVLFSYTNGAYKFSVKLCVVKFTSFARRFDGVWNKEWKEPKIGDSEITPR